MLIDQEVARVQPICRLHLHWDHRRGWWKRTEGKVARDVLSGNDELVTSQLSGFIPTNLPSVRLQNSVFNRDPDVSKVCTVLKIGK